jgi:hypothetical protein
VRQIDLLEHRLASGGNGRHCDFGRKAGCGRRDEYRACQGQRSQSDQKAGWQPGQYPM